MPNRTVYDKELNIHTYYGNLIVREDKEKYWLVLPSHSSEDVKEISKELYDLMLKEIGAREKGSYEYQLDEDDKYVSHSTIVF